MAKFTDAYIRQLPTTNKQQSFYDEDVPGFGVRVTPKGVKSFILRYRNRNGTERLITIGRFDVWGAAAAKTEAKRLLREEINIGIDPLAERQTAREALTVNELLDLYVKSARFEAKADNTQTIDKARLDRHVRPLLGKKVVAELSLNDIERALADISAGKTAATVKTKKRGLARVRGGEGTAKKAITLFRAACAWAVREKLIDSNPALGVELAKDGVRRQVLNAADYTAMFNALDALQSDGQLRQREADAIRLIALTGARRGEIAGLRREHVDARRKLIVLPRTGHKTGKSTGEERIIGLSKMALEIIDRQPEGDVVFPLDGPAVNKAWLLVREKAELPADFVPHGLRHSVASHLARDGAGAAQIMTALGHRDMATSQKYIHWMEEDREALAERAAGPALAGMTKKR